SSPSRLSRKVTPRNPPRHTSFVFRPRVIQDTGSGGCSTGSIRSESQNGSGRGPGCHSSLLL
ncbi:unnamed protein product, partial [Gulo gulo]